MSYAVRVEHVTKRFGNHVAVHDLSFEVPRGVIYGVLGPNGAGKSTMLRMINDIFAADEGEIRLLDGKRPGGEAAAHVGFLPEERGLYPKMRVAEMIAFMGELRGLRAREAKKRAGEWLERLGLVQWAKNRVQDLSKGMQQKVQFASTLIHQPELIILDEPWSGLDPINADVLRDVVRGEKAAGRTILFSTHLMEQAEQICDQICIIARGEKVLEGSLRDIKREAAAAGKVALGFVDEASRAKAAEVLGATPAGLEIEIDAPEGPALLTKLVAAGVALRRFEMVQPTLHEIFVQRVGESAKVATRQDA